MVKGLISTTPVLAVPSKSCLRSVVPLSSVYVRAGPAVLAPLKVVQEVDSMKLPEVQKRAEGRSLSLQSQV